MRASRDAAPTALSRFGWGGPPSASWAAKLVKDARSASHRAAAPGPAGSVPSSSTARHISRQVGSSWERTASPTRAAARSPRVSSYARMAGASTSVSKPGSVAGPAGGQIRGSSASLAALAPLMPGAGSIQLTRDARFASSSALCPVAQCRESASVAASSRDEPGY